MYSEITLDISVTTFYISIVFVLGKLIRAMLSGGANNIYMNEMPVPDYLINICHGIYIARVIGMQKQEKELYYELIDILRSPETVKKIVGNSSIKEKVD